MKSEMGSIALNAPSPGKKEVSLGVFLPVTFVASASHVSNSRIPRRRGRTSDALNAYRFPYTTHVTSFSSIHVLFQTYNGQSTISVLPAFLDLDFQD